MARIGAKLGEPLQNRLQEFLKEYTDVFPWTYDNIPGIGPEIASHQLNVQSQFKPVSQ